MTVHRLGLTFALGLLAAVASAPHAAGLATEQLGPGTINPGLGFGAELLAAVNTPSRVYWYEVNGNPYFFFRGSLREANDAIRLFAAIPGAKREIVLLPGAGQTTTLGGKTSVAYDWCLHTPQGIRFTANAESSDDRMTLTIHIPNARPVGKADPADLRRWVADLNSDTFRTRDQAARSLKRLGSAAAPALRDALKSAPSPEARERIERLLKGMLRIEVDLLELPANIPVIGVEAMLARSRKDLSHKDPQVRGYAVMGLSRCPVPAKEVLPDLVKVLQTERDEYTVRCAASALGRLGASAGPAVDELRKQAKAREGVVRQALEQALAVIEADEKEPYPEDADSRKVIRTQIAEFVRARSADKSR